MEETMSGHIPRLCLVAVAGALLALVPIGAAASSATATITAGTLAFVSTPGNPTISVTLNGLDQSPTGTLAMDVGDATGSGTGWNITATSTSFTTSSPVHTLSTAATSVKTAPLDSCDSNATCTLATNSVAYPYVLPAGGTAPTATKLITAALNTGLGDQTMTPTFTITIPANTFAGNYTSTWTFSLVSGP
jgi:hypothetical protein